jgi:tRNA A-37 threonylcarbamoyl transferase component Bud32
MFRVERIGRYKITKELGRGAMGVVYLATDPTIGRKVAIKTIRLRDIDNPAERTKQRERLFREARSAGSLSHPHIVTIYDMGEEDDVAYIALEYVKGTTLEEVLNQGQPLAPQRIFTILRQTAAALDFAHRNGVVHRDVKPANIMLNEGGQAKIADFGIAKLTEGESHTMTGTIVGTPNYMSPEQVQGLTLDGRSDQFSLGVIAYEILTGERPFSGEHLTTVVYKIVAEEPVAPQKLNPTLGAAIDTVLRKALSKKPALRYVDCSAFAGALEVACGNTRGWQARAASAGSSLPTAISVVAPKRPRKQTTGPRTKTAPPAPALRRRSAWPYFLVFGCVLLAMAGIAWKVDQGLQPPRTIEKSPTKPRPALAARPSPMPPPIDGGLPAPAGGTVTLDGVVPMELPAKPSGALRDVWVTTNPAGATATLDGSNADACPTPCMFHTPSGLHVLTITLVDFATERR